MIRKLWIGFYALALVVLAPVCLASVWLGVSAFMSYRRPWLEWLWLLPILFGPACLLWVTWRLLRREIARGKVSE